MPTTIDRETALAQLNGYVERGKMNAQTVVARVLDEVPTDSIVRPQILTFSPTSTNRISVTAGSWTQSLHDNALQQTSSRLGMPYSWAEEMIGKGEWGAELIANNLTTLAHQNVEPERRFLMRSVNHEVRGVLSDRFRRIDSRPIVDYLLRSTAENGLIPTDGVGSDTRVSLRFIRPEVLEPIDGEFMVFGFSWTNSDFGRGANEVQSFMLRLVCINGAVRASEIRNVHIGSRLDEELIQFSERTIRLDSAAVMSALKDTVRTLLLPAKIQEHMDVIRRASEEKIEPQALLAMLKKHMSKGQTQQVVDAFNSPDVEMLPPGQNRWRLSNALSFVARNAEPDRRIDLERLAGSVLN
jgi:hypothetical protein